MIIDPTGLAVSTLTAPNAPNAGAPQGITWLYTFFGGLAALVTVRLPTLKQKKL